MRVAVRMLVLSSILLAMVLSASANQRVAASDDELAVYRTVLNDAGASGRGVGLTPIILQIETRGQG
jgi:hypothetical protein